MRNKYAISLLLCAVMVVLGGCMAESGEFHSVSPHVETQDDDPRFGGMAGARNYYSLQSAVLSMIGARNEKSVIPVTDYDGLLDEDLQRLVLEITTENPLGCFAVASISFDQTRVLAYRELSITVQYKRTQQEIAAIREAPGPDDLERRLADFLSGYGNSAFYSVSNIADDADMLNARALKCWYSAAERAYGLKSITFVSYPENSPNRIIEVKVERLFTQKEQQEQMRLVDEKITSVCAVGAVGTVQDKLKFIANYLETNVKYNEQAMRALAGSTEMYPRTNTFTAYGAMIDGFAAQAGIMHAAKLMCDELKVPCTIVCGTSGGVSYCWLRVQNDGEWNNYDPFGSRELMDDEQAKDAGYAFYSEIYGELI